MCFCLDDPQTWITLVGLPLLTLWLLAVNLALFFVARRVIGAWRRNRLVVTTEPRPEKPPKEPKEPKRGNGDDEGNAGRGGPPEDWFGRIVVGIVLIAAVGVLFYMGWTLT